MKKRLTMFLACMFLSLGVALAQNKITGTVFEDNGEPCIGATVMIQGTKQGTKTDLDGHFTISVPAGKKLVISYVGMMNKTVVPKDGMKVTLEPDAQTLTEVVAVGMMKQDKRLFTGASAKVDADKAKLAGMADVSRSLEGRVAGVQVTNVSGSFGAAPKIRVRGATSIYGNSKPLWVIDGVIYEDNVDVSADELASGDAKTLISSAVAGLNSDDIESFTILKDGSATSIYGARAMAGVIVITTKKGSAGRASVNYTGEFSTRLKPSYRDYNIMNSQEMMGVYKEMADKGWLQLENLVNAKNTGVYGYMYQQLRVYDPSTGKFGLENTESARNKYLQDAEFRNTDWFDLLFSNSIQQNHSVSISGGTDRMQAYFSMSLMHDPGYYVNRNKVDRYTFNGNISYDILKNLTAKLAAQGSHRSQEAPGSLNQTTDVVTGAVNRDFDINPFSYALNTSRCLDPNTKYTRFYTGFNIFDELDYNYMEYDVNELMYRAELEWKPIKKVTVNGLISTRMSHSRRQHNVMDRSNQANAYRAGVDAQDDNSTIRDNNPLLYTNLDDEKALPESILPKGGIKYQYDDNMRSNTFRFMADYRDVFNEKHTLNAMIGSEYSSVKRTTTKWTGWGYQYDMGGIVYTPYLWLKQMNEENTDYFYEYTTQTNTLAYYGQLVYSFDKRYTINGTFRYEGTNRFGKVQSSRWLPTWNVSVAYDVINEPWMEKTRSWLSNLKLRGSYSLTADTGPTWVNNADVIYKTRNAWRPFTSAAESEIYIDYLANTELTFEKKHEWNVGVDLGFLNSRIALTFDMYWRNNYDLIGKVYTQGAGGQTEKYANLADMKSHGVEVGLSTVNIQTPKFKWTTDFIYSLAKNEVTSLENSCNAYYLIAGQHSRDPYMIPTLEGYPVRTIWSYQFAGLNEEGIPQVINENGEKTIGDVNIQETKNLENYLVYEGPQDPTWYGSIGNSFSFTTPKLGKLALDVFITYSGGNVIRLDPIFNADYRLSNTFTDLASMPKEYRNRWMQAGDERYTNIPTIPSLNQVDKYGSSTLATAYNVYNYSTERIAKGDFVRLKELALTYTFPQGLLKKTKLVNTASIKLAATNLCLLYADKKLNGSDPEFVNSGGVSTPISKQFTATVRIGF